MSSKAHNFGSDRDTLKDVDTELQLLLLKPIVKDYFDKIEFLWSLLDTKTKGPAIRTYVERNEKEGVPSVIDMLEKLYAYEQVIIDTHLSDGRIASIFETNKNRPQTS